MTTNIQPETLAALRLALQRGMAPFRADPRMPLSVWAERHFMLDRDSSQQAGGWSCWPFQVALMDWMSDDRIVRVIIRKSKRVGYTKILTALLCYVVAHLRRNAALWQPTDDDRDSFVRTELDPVTSGVRIVRDQRRGTGADDTLKLKRFRAAVLHLLGGKAARAYRRITVALAILDEWSAFDQSIEGQGDPGSLAFGRLEGAPFPKFVGGSTPGTRGACHVTLAADQADVDMRYHIDCPHCGVEHPLTTGIDPKTGSRTRHGLQWTPGQPATAVHICPHCLQPMTRAQYLAGGQPMAGEWVCIRTGLRYTTDRRWLDAAGQETRPPRNVAAQIWSAYSPQRDWTSIAEDHEKADAAEQAGDSSLMITLVNETYGEPYEVRGQRRDDHALSSQSGKHAFGIVPIGALKLTSGIDVQQDRVEIGVWGWGRGMESWVIDHHIIEGNPAADDAIWDAVGTYLLRRYRQAWHGGTLGIDSISIDSGWATHAVYAFVRAQAGTLPIRAIKGKDEPKAPIKMAATVQDINWRGQKWIGGIKLWGVGTQSSEDLLHGQLGLDKPGPGYIHYADSLPQEWYAQLTGKTRVPTRSKHSIVEKWIRSRPRVEVRDCRRYAHHAALCLGIDSYTAARWTELEHQVQPPRDLFSDPPTTAELLAEAPATTPAPLPTAVAPPPPQASAPPLRRARPRLFGG
ncbi:MAG: hypothetical protein RL260_432 [Pseudomonadota bacterium]|jgi:phage terminase large subunit GpA-like protein